MKMIFGKRQLVLAMLVVILGGAIYVNWKFANSGNDFTVSNSVNGQSENYGDTEMVDSPNGEKKQSKDANSQNSTSYFADTKLQKQKQRDDTTETLQASINSKDISASEKAKLTEQLSNLVAQVEAENKIESLIKAKGFEDCVAFLDDNKANIVVKSSGLSGEQAAQIKDIVLQNAKVSVENLRIVEVK